MGKDKSNPEEKILKESQKLSENLLLQKDTVTNIWHIHVQVDKSFDEPKGFPSREQLISVTEEIALGLKSLSNEIVKSPQPDKVSLRTRVKFLIRIIKQIIEPLCQDNGISFTADDLSIANAGYLLEINLDPSNNDSLKLQAILNEASKQIQGINQNLSEKIQRGLNQKVQRA